MDAVGPRSGSKAAAQIRPSVLASARLQGPFGRPRRRSGTASHCLSRPRKTRSGTQTARRSDLVNRRPPGSATAVCERRAKAGRDAQCSVDCFLVTKALRLIADGRRRAGGLACAWTGSSPAGLSSADVPGGYPVIFGHPHIPCGHRRDGQRWGCLPRSSAWSTCSVRL